LEQEYFSEFKSIVKAHEVIYQRAMFEEKTSGKKSVEIVP
jgi:hypothetical protein